MGYTTLLIYDKHYITEITLQSTKLNSSEDEQYWMDPE